MNEDELRRRAGKQRKIPEQSWAYLQDMGFVEDALERASDEEMVGYIVEKFDKLAAASPGTRNRTQTVNQERSEVPVSLSDTELERKAAFEEYVALRAACDASTRRFRNEVLDDRLLTAQQARQLIRSPAAQFFEANSFEFGGGDIPLIGHHATLEGYEREKGRGKEVCHRARISVDPPSRTKTTEITFHEAPRPAYKRLRENYGDGQALYFVDEIGRARYVSVWSWSVLEQLRSLCKWLAQEYRWEFAQATMFVLTGEIPAVPALKVTRSYRQVLETATIEEHIDATITVTASAWVSSGTVTRAYRKAQTTVLGSSGGRPPSSKNLQLFRFVTERIELLDARATHEGSTSTQGHTKMPEGKRLVGEWNEAYPQWAYKTSVGDLDTRQFWRDYNRIKRTIAVGPPYKRPRTTTAQPPGQSL